MFENKIEFICINQDMANVWPHPKPATRFIPEEYKKLQRFPMEGNLNHPSVKTCVPFLDSMTAGYIIPYDQDYLIDPIGSIDHPIEPGNGEWYMMGSQKQENSEYHHNAQLPPEWHDRVKTKAGKFGNKWLIITPPGYSCLFVKPMNRHKENRIDIIPGIVDTDSYINAINFPFINNKFDEQFILKKGDPMVQVFPFKRESWKMWSGFRREKRHVLTENSNLSLWMDKYKKLFWKKKSYR